MRLNAYILLSLFEILRYYYYSVKANSVWTEVRLDCSHYWQFYLPIVTQIAAIQIHHPI